VDKIPAAAHEFNTSVGYRDKKFNIHDLMVDDGPILSDKVIRQFVAKPD
jgi:hypothetical protein